MKTFSLTFKLSLWLSLAYFLPLQPACAESVSGHIEIAAGSPVKKIIVYLQSGSTNHNGAEQSKIYQVSQHCRHLLFVE